MWILLFTALSTSYNAPLATSITAEYSSEAKCNAAAARQEQMYRKSERTSDPRVLVVTYSCSEK